MKSFLTVVKNPLLFKGLLIMKVTSFFLLVFAMHVAGEGGVHFTTSPTDGVITTANRTSVDTFYNQVFIQNQGYQ